jgi:hypothetical protein
MEPKRCGNCGQVTVCDCVTCPACHQPRLRALTEQERAVYDSLVGEHGPDMAGRCTAVRCELARA